MQRELPDGGARGREAPGPAARHTMCPQEGEDRSFVGPARTITVDARWNVGRTRGCDRASQGRSRGGNRALQEAEAGRAEGSAGVPEEFIEDLSRRRYVGQ